jgi:hypothetical protein
VITIQRLSGSESQAGEWDVDLSLLNSQWDVVDRNHPAVTVNIEFLTGTPSGNLGVWLLKKSGTGTLSVGYFDSQLELGEVSTPMIESGATAGVRSKTTTTTPIAETKLKAAESFILITAVPDRAGQTGALASTFTDSDNSTDVLINSTDITLRKRIATVDNDAVISYTHAADTPFAVIAIWDGTNMRVTAADVGGTFPAYQTNGNTADAILGTVLESSSRDGGEQFQGEGVYVSSFTSEAQLLTFVDANGVASTANL